VWSKTSGLRPFDDHSAASSHVAVEISKGGEIIIMVYDHGFAVIRDGETTDYPGRPNIPGVGVV
jgi:hypothetical protein